MTQIRLINVVQHLKAVELLAPVGGLPPGATRRRRKNAACIAQQSRRLS
jgi:hypothetical protein